jgi:hypothetical protein
VKVWYLPGHDIHGNVIVLASLLHSLVDVFCMVIVGVGVGGSWLGEVGHYTQPTAQGP